MSSARTIHLRRPPTLHLQETLFVPQVREQRWTSETLLEEVDRRWESLQADNPSLHDGRMCHVLGVHRNGHGGAAIHVMDCAYRFYAVQDESFDLGVRHLGVKAVTTHHQQVLLGRRSMRVRAYPGLWEFAPGGVIEPGRQPLDVLRSEFAEETGLDVYGEPTAMAIVYDPVLCCWEIVYRATARSDRLCPQTDEYSELQWCTFEDIPRPLSPASQQILRLLPRLQ